MRNLLALIILIIIIAGAGFAFTRLKNQQNQGDQSSPAEKLNAVLSVIEGTPEVKQAGKDDFVEGGEGFALNTGDTVKTDETTRALILFADNSSVSLDYSTIITLTEIPTEEGGNVDLLQEAGQAWHRVEKLGKNENYQVQTPTAIAAVRGTKFISMVASPDLSNIHTVESTVLVTPFIDGEKIEGTEVNEGDWVDIVRSKKEEYKSTNLKSFVAKFLQEKSKFFRYNECIDRYVPETIKDATTLREKFALIRDKLRALAECEKILGEVASPTPTPSLTQTPGAATVSWVKAIISGGVLKCSWDAKGTDISGYEYSAGTGAGSTNYAGWKRTGNKAADIPGTLQNYSKYFCNVRVLSPWGSNQKSSGAVLYDPSAGNIIRLSPTIGFTAPSWGVTVSVDYANMDINDIDVKVNIKNSAGQYFNGNGWQGNIYWFSTSCDGISCYVGGMFSGIGGATANVEYRNGNPASGKLLDTDSKQF